MEGGLTEDEKSAVRRGWFVPGVEALSAGDIFWIDGDLSRSAASFLRNEICDHLGIEANLLVLPPDWDLVIVPLRVDLDLVSEIARLRAAGRSR